MAYETGVSTSPTDLLSKIETHLNGNGWTIVRDNGLAESGSSDQLSVSDPDAAESNQFNMVAVDSSLTAEIRLQASTGDSGSGAHFYAHTGSPNNSGSISTFTRMGHPASTNAMGFAGPFTAYHIFSGLGVDGRYCHVVVESSPGIFWHMMFGTVTKAGAFTGGQYTLGLALQSQSVSITWPGQLSSSSPGKNWIRADAVLGSSTPGWQGAHFDWHGQTFLLAPLYQQGYIQFNQRTPFAPSLAPFWNSETPLPGTNPFCILGHLADLRLVSMHGREGNEIVTLGSDTWHVFPVFRKTVDGTSLTVAAYGDTHTSGTPPYHDSNIAGFAYREAA